VCKRLASFVGIKSSTKTETTDTKEENSHDANVLNNVIYLDLTSSSSTSAAAAAASSSAGQSISSVERQLASITNLLETRLRTDDELYRQRDMNQEMMNEWMIAAAVIDRVCFIVFLIVIVVASLIFAMLLIFHA